MPLTEPQLGLLAAVPVWEHAAAVTRACAYGGVLLAAGGGAFLTVVHDRRSEERRLLAAIVAGAALLGAVATLLTVPLHAIAISGAGAASGLSGETFAVSLASVVGISALVRLAGLAVLLAGVPAVLAGHRAWLVLTGGAIATLSFVLAGHTVTAEPRWLAYTADGIHVVAASLWFGGLVLLGAALGRRRSSGEALSGAGMVARFSGLATAALVLVTAAGVALAWTEIRTLDMLVTSDYGRLLLLKVGIVALVVAIGAYNNRRLVPAIARVDGDGASADQAVAWRRLGTTVRLEAVGIIAAIAVTAALVHEPPPRPYTDQPGHDVGAGNVIATEEAPR